MERHEYRQCDAGAVIDYYIVDGMGQTWPPLQGVAPRLAGPPTSQLNGTDAIWTFFQDKQLPSR